MTYKGWYAIKLNQPTKSISWNDSFFLILFTIYNTYAYNMYKYYK